MFNSKSPIARSITPHYYIKYTLFLQPAWYGLRTANYSKLVAMASVIILENAI